MITCNFWSAAFSDGNFVKVAIPVCSLLAAIASAIAACKSAASANAANALAKEVLTKRAQSELFLKVLLELARIHRLMADFISGGDSDADFCLVFDGKAAGELRLLLQELNALSPHSRVSLKEDSSLTGFLKRLSSAPFVPSKEDLDLLQRIIDLLHNCHRQELNTP